MTQKGAHPSASIEGLWAESAVGADLPADRARRRDGERLLLSIEHRAAEFSSGIELALGDRGGGLTLHVREDAGPATAEQPRSPVERVLEALGSAEQPLSRRELRETCRLRNATLVDTLAALPADGNRESPFRCVRPRALP